MTETNATSECCCACQDWQNEMATCGNPVEIARKVKLAFKKMPGEMALACFAKVMTAVLPHPIKVAVWDAVRYSHIWWGVDEVLKGSVMEDPIVQQAFADAVPMRRWMVEQKYTGYERIRFTIRDHGKFAKFRNMLDVVILTVTHAEDEAAARFLRHVCNNSSEINSKVIARHLDNHGRNLLWYLTYRDDQNARGGFACPCLERELLRLGVDPNRRNNIGLCWNDVRRHVIRLEV